MLKSLFPLSLKAIHDENVVTLQSGGMITASVFVIPRSLCQFERHWSPRADQKGLDAVKLAIAQNTSVTLPGIFIEPHEKDTASFVNCWVWDNEVATARIKPNSLLLPESYARVPGETGARLVECMYGYEGQIWENKMLVASRWWRNAPSDLDWAEFIEGSEVAIGTFSLPTDILRNKPVVSSVLWRDDVSLADFGTAAIETTITPMRAFLAACVVLSLPLAYSVGSAAKLTQEVSQAQSKLDTLQIELGDVADARRAAIANRAIIERYQASGDPFHMVDSLEDFGLATQPSEVTVRVLSYNGDSIEITFSADERLLLPDLIRKLELSQNWAAASASRNTNGEIVLRGQLQTSDPSS